MSKELEALERIKSDLEYITRLDYVDPIVRGEVREELYKIYHRELPELNIIETALKEKEQQDNVLKVLKEVIQFNRTLPEVEISDDGSIGKFCERIAMRQLRDIENKERELLRKWVLETCFPKELKALEIIKIKRVNVEWLLESENVEEYNESLYENLTQEEYELLQGVLL